MRKLILFSLLFLWGSTYYADWQKINGIDFSNINCIAELYGNVYLGSESGIYKSSDGGVNFININNGLGEISVKCITTLGETIFIGTKDDGVFYSPNSGSSWLSVNSGLSFAEIVDIISIDQTLFVSIKNQGVYKSENNGLLWVQSNVGLTNYNVNKFLQIENNIYCVTDSGGVYVSDKSNINWQAINFGLPSNYSVFDITKSGNNLIISTQAGVFYSQNGGQFWIAANNGITNSIAYKLLTVGDLVFLGTRNGSIYKSTDYGLNWTKVNQTSYNIVKDIKYFLNKIYVCFESYGILSSANFGNTWTLNVLTTADISNTQVRGILCLGSDIFISSYGGKMYYSKDDGTTWTDITGNMVCGNSYDMVEAEQYVFVTTDNGLYRTKKDTINWVPVNNGLQVLPCGAIIYQDNKLYLGTRYGGMYTSTNFGESWNYIGLNGLIVLTIVKYGNYIFAGTHENEICYTTDEGATWQKTGNFVGRVNRVLVKNGYLFAGTYYDGIHRCVIGEFNWTRLGDNPTFFPFTLYMANYNEYIVVGTLEHGILISNDNGNSFYQLNNGYPFNTSVCSFNYNNNYLFSGTLNGFYRQPVVSNLMAITEVEEENNNEVIPSAYALHQNFPNPFNPSTTISFSIPNTEFVTLKIYDSVGKEVETLVNENLPAGSYNKQFNATNLASGVYFYRLQAGSYYQTNKMILMK